MLLERYYDDALAQASYLVACERSREAIIVDPNRDVDAYLRAATAHRLRIAYVTETHIHADFLSGARDLARAARATLVLSGHGGDGWRYMYAADEAAQLVKEGDSLTLGKVRLDVLHTPGHTPEHVSFLVTDTAAGEHAMGMMTGDFVFVGDVGRPDLLERAAKLTGTMESAARQLYASLQRLAAFPDYLQLWPGHGAGSACGKSLGAVPQTTLGYERLYNPAFQQTTESAFVRWVLADQPEPPRYFAVMKRLNRDGPPPRPAPRAELPQLDAPDVEDAIDKGHWVVDVRGSADFAAGHMPGTVNIPLSKTFATYAGTVLSYDRPVVLVAKSRDQAMAAQRLLTLIGLDDVTGYAALDVLQQRKRDGKPIATIPLVAPADLSAKLAANGPRVIDVRGRAEWNEGHLPRATHIFYGDLLDRIEELEPDAPVVVHCESGARASIAASLLMSRGFRDVANLAGGVVAWKRAGLPVSDGEEGQILE